MSARWNYRPDGIPSIIPVRKLIHMCYISTFGHMRVCKNPTTFTNEIIFYEEMPDKDHCICKHCQQLVEDQLNGLPVEPT
jgi:hypothetical protein